MKKAIDCARFGRRFDDWIGGALEPEAEDAMRRHAESCPICGTQLAVHRHLSRPSQAELEAAVPDEWIESTWNQVADAVARGRWPAEGRGIRPRRRGWLVPAMAAAIAALVLGTGFLLGELDRLRDREAALAAALVQHEARLDDLEAGGGLAGIAGTGDASGLAAWERRLTRRGPLSLGELEGILSGLPADVTVLSSSQLDALRANPLLGGAGGAAEASRRELLVGIDTDDGLQAAELLKLVRSLDLDPETAITSSRLRAVSRMLLDPGRS